MLRIDFFIFETFEAKPHSKRDELLESSTSVEKAVHELSPVDGFGELLGLA